MIWALNIQSAINEMGGVQCGLIYFSGTHFTIPITLTREKTAHLDMRIRQKVDLHKKNGYTYTIQYIKEKAIGNKGNQ